MQGPNGFKKWESDLLGLPFFCVKKREVVQSGAICFVAGYGCFCGKVVLKNCRMSENMFLDQQCCDCLFMDRRPKKRGHKIDLFNMINDINIEA